MGGVLGIYLWDMPQAEYCFLDIARHGDIDIPEVIMPVERQTAVV